MKGENEAQNPETKGTAGQCTVLRHVTQKRLRATPIGRVRLLIQSLTRKNASKLLLKIPFPSPPPPPPKKMNEEKKEQKPTILSNNMHPFLFLTRSQLEGER